MEINKGEITVVIGRGKSEFLKSFDIDGKKSFYLDNNFDDFFCNSIYDDIYFVLKKRGFKNIDKRILNSISMVKLDYSCLSRSISSLSLGEKKKVSLARLLACNPRFLYLNEPFFGLDLCSKKEFIRLFKMMKVRYGKTFVISTDDMNLAFELADNLIVLNGDVVFSGNKYDFFTSEKLVSKYNICVPKLVEFVSYVRKNKNVKLSYRDDISDIMKDIYRFVR